MRDMLRLMTPSGPLQAFSNLLASRPVNTVRRPAPSHGAGLGTEASADRVASGLARRAAALAEGRILPRGSLLDMLV